MQVLADSAYGGGEARAALRCREASPGDQGRFRLRHRRCPAASTATTSIVDRRRPHRRLPGRAAPSTRCAGQGSTRGLRAFVATAAARSAADAPPPKKGRTDPRPRARRRARRKHARRVARRRLRSRLPAMATQWSNAPSRGSSPPPTPPRPLPRRRTQPARPLHPHRRDQPAPTHQLGLTPDGPTWALTRERAREPTNRTAHDESHPVGRLTLSHRLFGSAINPDPTEPNDAARLRGSASFNSVLAVDPSRVVQAAVSSREIGVLWPRALCGRRQLSCAGEPAS